MTTHLPTTKPLMLFLLAAIASQTSNVLAKGPVFTRINAAADSATTAYDNPAGMTRFDSDTTSLSFTFFNSFSSFDVDESQTNVDGGDADESDPVGVPGIYTIHRLGDSEWRTGFSLSLLSGFGSDRGDDWAGRYHSESFSLAFIGFTPSIAYPLTEHFSVGLSVPVSFSFSESETRLKNPAPGGEDGKLEVNTDDISMSFVISTLYEIDEYTRFALIYRAETEYDSEPDFKLKHPSLPDGTIKNVEGQLDTLKLTYKQPQSVSFGFFHDFQNNWQVTMDAVWVEFSEFRANDISLNGQDVNVDTSLFNDVWGYSIGLQYQYSERVALQFGVMHLEQAVDDKNRNFSIPLDRLYGIGFGISKKLENGNGYDLSFNLIDLGDAPIDTGDDPAKGRVVGKNDNPYALAISYAYHWR